MGALFFGIRLVQDGLLALQVAEGSSQPERRSVSRCVTARQVGVWVSRAVQPGGDRVPMYIQQYLFANNSIEARRGEVEVGALRTKTECESGTMRRLLLGGTCEGLVVEGGRNVLGRREPEAQSNLGGGRPLFIYTIIYLYLSL